MTVKSKRHRNGGAQDEPLESQIISLCVSEAQCI